MESKLKKFSEKCADLFCILIYMLIGAMMGSVIVVMFIDAQYAKEGRYDSIELQHQVMIEQNEEFNYCPYCGEKLER